MAERPGLPRAVVADLRTDHAGETGVVGMHPGVLCFARDAALREFALRRRAAEQAYPERIGAWLPPADRSRSLPTWRLSGWLAGALPALPGTKAAYPCLRSA